MQRAVIIKVFCTGQNISVLIKYLCEHSCSHKVSAQLIAAVCLVALKQAVVLNCALCPVIVFCVVVAVLRVKRRRQVRCSCILKCRSHRYNKIWLVIFHCFNRIYYRKRICFKQIFHLSPCLFAVVAVFSLTSLKCTKASLIGPIRKPCDFCIGLLVPEPSHCLCKPCCKACFTESRLSVILNNNKIILIIAKLICIFVVQAAYFICALYIMALFSSVACIVVIYIIHLITAVSYTFKNDFRFHSGIFQILKNKISPLAVIGGMAVAYA